MWDGYLVSYRLSKVTRNPHWYKPHIFLWQSNLFVCTGNHGQNLNSISFPSKASQTPHSIFWLPYCPTVLCLFIVVRRHFSAIRRWIVPISFVWNRVFDLFDSHGHGLSWLMDRFRLLSLLWLIFWYPWGYCLLSPCDIWDYYYGFFDKVHCS